MAPRASWKGLLQISRVQIPIKVFPATESSEGLSFHQLHSVCQSRMQQKKWCPLCAREVPSGEVVKGYEFEKDKYVLLLPEELDAVAPPSTRVIDLVQFAEARALDALFIDRSYYLVPDGPESGPGYAVVSDAMHGKVGVGKLALYGREYLVAVVARGVSSPTQRAILLLHTLHHPAEIRAAADVGYFGMPGMAIGPSVRLARQVIEAFPQRLNLAALPDEYQRDQRALIDAKIAGHEIIESAPAPSVPVLNLQEALTQSLAVLKGKPTRKRA